MPSVDWSGVAIKGWEALTEHPKLVIPACSLFGLAFWVAIWQTHPTGALGFGAWFAAIVLTGAALFVLPVYGWSESRRIDARLRTVSDAEDLVIRHLIERESTVRRWPHDPCVAGLLQDRIVEKRPNTILNGYEVFALTNRARKRVLNAYTDTIV
jgi:hypothetical protein